MTQADPPKIEFPCPNYPIKIMGVASDQYRDEVLNIVQKHDPGMDRLRCKVQASSKGSFQSITVFIEATGVAQLEAIFVDLKKHPSTRMVI